MTRYLTRIMGVELVSLRKCEMDHLFCSGILLCICKTLECMNSFFGFTLVACCIRLRPLRHRWRETGVSVTCHALIGFHSDSFVFFNN